MLKIAGSSNLHRIIVLNPKGGSGKSTLAFNLAGYLATTGRRVALIDMDPQGSSVHWLVKRPTEMAPIHGVPPRGTSAEVQHPDLIKLPSDIDFAVIDAPAGLAGDALADYTTGAHAIIVPVLPSEFDIRAASRLIADLLLVARVSRTNRRLGIIANRVNERTIAYRQLTKFLDRLSITVVGVLRDSQNYVSAAREGLCIQELPPARAHKDLEQWKPVTRWLEERLATPLTERDLMKPAAKGRPAVKPRFQGWRLAAAAGLAAMALAAYAWHSVQDPEPGSVVAAAGTADSAMPAGNGSDTEPSGTSKPAAGPTPEVAVTEETPAQALSQAPIVDIDSEVSAVSPPTFDGAPRDKWQLRGVAQSDGTHVVLLADPTDSSNKTATNEREFDGWLVKDTGRDFAVLVKDETEVRLRLSEETPSRQ